MRSFQEASEFGGRKQSDVAGSPSPDNHRILLVDHLVENAGQILAQTGICCFPGHHGPISYCTAFLYGYGDPSTLAAQPAVFRGRAIVLSQADLWGVIGSPLFTASDTTRAPRPSLPSMRYDRSDAGPSHQMWTCDQG